MIQAQLNTFLEQIQQKIHLEQLIQQLNMKVAKQSHNTEILYNAMLAEQSDVDKLEAGGIGTVFHKLTGRMEEKLDKERMEAQTASEEYESAAAVLAQTKTQLEKAEKTLESLQDCRTEYTQLMLNRIQDLEKCLQSADNPEQAEELKALLQLERRRKSLREGLLESDDAERAAQKHLSILLAAKNDPNAADGPSYTEAYLQEIEIHTESMLSEITDIQSKLAQMSIDPGPHITIGAYLRAPVIFLIGAAGETTLQQRLQEAIQQIECLRDEIAQVSEKLTDALNQIENAIARY